MSWGRGTSSRIAARRRLSLLGTAALAALALTAAACASPEQRLERYMTSGAEFLEAGKLGLANVQYLNALKIDDDNVDALKGLATVAEKRGEFEQMFGILQRINRIDPANDAVKLDLAKLHLLANDAAKALDLVDKALAASPRNADALAVKAAIMFRVQNNAEAVDLASKALAIDPNVQEAVAVLAGDRVLAKDFEGALGILDAAIARDDKAPVLQLLRVQVLGNLGRTDDINAAHQGLIAHYPDDADYRRLYATSLIAQENLEEARAQLVEVARILHRQREAKLDVVRIDYRIGGKAKAEGTLRGFIAADSENEDMRFALGAFLRDERDFKGAEAAYQEIVGAKDASIDHILLAKNEIAAIRMLEGRRLDAEKIIAEILAADARNPDALVRRAGFKIDDGAADEAIADLRIAVDERPLSVPARLLLGAAYESKGDFNLAEREFAQAVETAARAAGPSNHFARYLLRRGKRDRAEKILAESIAVDATSADNLKLLAAIRLEDQNWRGAEQAATALRAVNDADGDVNRILGAVYTGLKDYAGAIDVLTKAHQRDALAGRPLATLIQAFVDAGRGADAEAFLKDTIERNPNQYDARILLAQLERASGRGPETIGTLKAAIKLDPLRPEGYEALYGVLTLDGRRLDAGAVIEQAVTVLPDNAGLQVLMADHQIAMEQPDAAIAIYETILARRPSDLIVANNLASLLLERDDAPSIARAAAAAEALKGADNAYFLDTYGWALYRSGRLAEGVAALQRAVEKAPGLVDARYHLGVALLGTGEAARGRAELQAVIDAPGADAGRVADARRRFEQD